MGAVSVGKSSLLQPASTSFWRWRNYLGVLYLGSICLGVGLWFAVAFFDTRGLLPPPSEVVATAWTLVRDGTLLNNVLASLGRVLIGFILAVLLAIPVGFA